MKKRQDIDELLSDYERLKKENLYLKNLITKIMHNRENNENIDEKNAMINNQSSVNEKIALFKSLFRGRTDAYALRWESKSGSSGYIPACANEWQKPHCMKPQIKCSECQNRVLLPLTDQTIYDHLSGKKVIGLYTLQKDDSCSLLAFDFDKQNWKEDVKALVDVCKELTIPVGIERSRSGNGAHVWIFFSEILPAHIARKFGAGILSKTMEKRHQVGLDSYDRMFPNQNTLPTGGFGNLIGLPLQQFARKNGNSVFVDENLIPFPDQWVFLSTIQKLSKQQVHKLLNSLEDASLTPQKIIGNVPKKITIELKNGLYINKEKLPSPVITNLIKMASINNPEYYKAEAKRLSTHGIPRIINCTWDNRECLVLPRVVWMRYLNCFIN